MNQRVNIKPRFILVSVFWMPLLALLYFTFHSCSNDENSDLVAVEIPISVTYQPSTELAQEEDSLELVSSATVVTASISGCSSGYTAGTTVQTSTITMYLTDKNCLVKLQSFIFQNTTYSATATGATNFTTWLAGDAASFASTASSTNVIKVKVGTQVTQAGILNTDVVSYLFTDISSTTTQNLTQPSVSTPVPLSVSGKSPNFTLTAARTLAINANGSYSVSFTLQCGVLQTGSGATAACDGATLQATTPAQLSYIFIPDVYSQGALDVTQLTAAFGANTPTSVGTLTVNPGGADLNGNTLTNGGFYTSNASPLVTGTTPVYPSALNYVFMLRRSDSFSNALGYLYFYVTFPSFSSLVSGCGTTFAGGAGTAADPYGVNDRTTLANTVNCATSATYFVQTANIDLGGSGNPWIPIQLNGQYNGNGNSITGLYVNRSTASASDALFTSIATGASVSNLNITSASVSSAGTKIGILAADASGSITNVTVSGTVATQGTIASTVIIGGLIGNLASGGSITSSSSTASVTWGATTLTGTTVQMGGLVGNTSGTSITSCSYVGTITATQRVGTFVLNAVGGLVGSVTAGSVSQNYAIATMSVNPNTSLGPQDIGGLVGQTAASITLSQNYASGSMTVTRVASTAVYSIGGMVGLAGATSTIINSYTMVTMSVTTATATDFYGGFVGKAVAITDCYSANPTMSTTQGNAFAKASGVTGTVTTSYYDSIGGLPTQGAITGLSAITPANIATQGSFTGFDFATPIWRMPSANPLASPNTTLSPVLDWQCGSNGITCI